MKKYSSTTGYLLSILLLLLLTVKMVFAAEVGQKVYNIELINASDMAEYFPSFGEKILTILYIDPRARDFLNNLQITMKNTGFDNSKEQPIAIVNVNEIWWIPDFVIKKIMKRDQKKNPHVKIFLDYTETLKGQWNLGDCKEKVVVIVVGKDQKIKFITKVASLDQGNALIPILPPLVQAEIDKLE